MLLKCRIKGAQQWAFIILTSIFLMTGANCIASETESRASGPPVTFRLDEVSINLTRHACVIKGCTEKKISILGSGRSTIMKDGNVLSFVYSSKNLMTLLNSFYRIRFFNLPTRHNIKYSVFLNENGLIGTNALRMVDASNTTVCFSIPDYKKCVTYGLDGAYELEQLAQLLFSEADKLTHSSETEH